MTYDTLLSLRGWGADELERATPDFLSAARFALFAERLAPILSEGQAILDMPMPEDAKSKLAMAEQKMTAERQIPIVRAALFPDDDG